MSAAPVRVGILGGTFDPIHEGHIAAARAAMDTLDLDRVLLVASHQPPHRCQQPKTSAYHRFAMVSLACAADPRLQASDVELVHDGPSYTAQTLRRLAGPAPGLRPSQLFFIIGTDAFAEIASWYDYPAVLDLAHFVVVSRPGQSFDALRARVPDVAGRLREARKAPVAAPASTGAEADTADLAVFLVNAATPDVSSTDIRNRAGRGLPLAGLVPPGVERHIVRHGLYGYPSSTPSGSTLA
jgi:nicotinate-nucleotide adenylyltransferase